MNQAENQAENSELLNQQNEAAVSDEKQEGQLVNSNSAESESESGNENGDEKPNVEASNGEQTESEDESDDGSFEWTQKRSASATNNGINLYLLRNSTSLFQWTVALGYTNTTTALIVGSSINYVDSPATTSSVTYKTQFASYNNSGTVRIQSNNDRSTIILMEIAG
jgi:hypothetical protein